MNTAICRAVNFIFALTVSRLLFALVFPSAEPALAYLNSTRSVREAELPHGVNWDEMMMIVREQIGRLIDHFGELTVNTLSGLLVATDRGDFIDEYAEKLTKVKEQTKPLKPPRKSRRGR